MRRAGSRIDAEEKDTETQRKTEDHPNLNAAAPRPFSQRSQAQSREERENDHSREGRKPQERSAGCPRKTDVHEGLGGERLHPQDKEIAHHSSENGGRAPPDERVAKQPGGEQLKHQPSSRPKGERSLTGR